MSDFIENLVDLLPEHNSMKKPDNQLRKVLDYSVGEWFDNRFDITSFRNNLFLQTAKGKWLDLFGLDYGIPRNVDEVDEDYRQRIIFEKLDNLTADTLTGEYGVELFNAFDCFNPTNNDLTSDNPYMSNFLFGVVDTETQKILDNKFIIDNLLVWFDGTELDGIIKTDNSKVLKNYLELYQLEDLDGYFDGNNSIRQVKLTLPYVKTAYNFLNDCTGLIKATLIFPNVVTCPYLLYGCSSLSTVKLDLPNAIYCEALLSTCESLTSVDLNLPRAEDCKNLLNGSDSLTSVDLNLPQAKGCENMFEDCSSLTSVKLDLPEALNCDSLLMLCKSLVNATLNLPKLTSFINIIDGCTALEYLNVNVPTALVTDFKSYVLDILEFLPNLSTFILNGEEVDLS